MFEKYMTFPMGKSAVGGCSDLQNCTGPMLLTSLHCVVLWVMTPEGTVVPVAKGIVTDILGRPWKALTLS